MVIRAGTSNDQRSFPAMVGETSHLLLPAASSRDGMFDATRRINSRWNEKPFRFYAISATILAGVLAILAATSYSSSSDAMMLLKNGLDDVPLLGGSRHHHHESKKNSRIITMKPDEAMEAARATGIQVSSGIDKATPVFWTGDRGGKIKDRGPLVGKKVGVLVAAEFSDFQVYYLASYLGEFGGTCEFLLVDWVTWKNVRPNVRDKGVRGLWDLSVDPMAVMFGSNKAAMYKGLRDADASEYDAVVIVGGHSADVMVTEPEVTSFLRAAGDNGAILGSIGAGSMPLIAADLLRGTKVATNPLVDFMLKKIADVQEKATVVTDGNMITASDTVDTPEFVRALCRAFDPEYKDVWKGALQGKTVLLPVGEDYEDIELIVPTLEFLHRGAKVVIGRFPPQFRARPAHDSSFVQGNFGTTIPFQEIPDSYYSIEQRLDKIKMSHFDVAVITGAMNPWNMVATGSYRWLEKAHSAGKLIAAICHGPIALAAADLVKGRKLTGWLASKDSVEIMGGEFNNTAWTAVIDDRIVTGRTPPELPEFLDAISVALLAGSKGQQEISRFEI